MTAPGPIPLQPGWVYGPVASRRLGRSLGVNLLPVHARICSMDCVYCQYAPPSGRHAPEDEPGFPTVAAVCAEVEEALRRDPTVDAVTLAGNGEPTLHPSFGAVLRGIAALRDRLAPTARLVLLTNGTRLTQPRVRAALDLVDLPVVKLDAGDDEALRRINRPRGVRLDEIQRGIQALPRVVIQAMFVTGAVDNTGPAQLSAWLERLRALAPASVQVTTIDRGTAMSGLLPVPARRLEEIAGRVRELGIPAQAFPCRNEEEWAEEREGESGD